MISTLPTAWACILGVSAGLASMLIFRELSPQDRLRRLTDQITDVRRQLAVYEGEFSGAWELTRANLRLSFQRLGYALWPAMGSSIAVVLGLSVIGDSYIPYFLAVFVTALSAKIQLKIA